MYGEVQIARRKNKKGRAMGGVMGIRKELSEGEERIKTETV